ncbi:unnamed protein product, partial [Protopolystoma xenopodis]
SPCGYRLSHALRTLRPKHVILFEPQVAWVRTLEVHSARCKAEVLDDTQRIGEQKAVDANLKTVYNDSGFTVYFMVLADSLEEQRYLTCLRREREAFGALIKLSSRIVVPKDFILPIDEDVLSDQLGSTNSLVIEKRIPRVIVDMREFRSELPALLYRKGIKVEPLTLLVADYILAPHLCVERKSVSDLIGSLNSGRLYQQCTAMSRYYANPILLIEFSMSSRGF